MARELISARDAADRLSVKPATLYAYVSRGMIARHHRAGERGSWFDPAEIDALARAHGGVRRSGLDIGIATSVTRIDGRRLWYRGRDATGLARRASFESVASLLWGDPEPVPPPWTADPAALRRARRAGPALGPYARLVDRLALSVAVAATSDPLRFDLSPPAVTSAARRLLATMVDALPVIGEGPVPELVTGDGEPVRLSLAGRLWPRLSPGPASALATAAVNRVLVLLADHELATSTVGARLAASTRADPYAVVASALGVLDGPLHGSSSDEVVALLRRSAEPGGAVAAVGEWLRQGRRLPGLGHPVYDDADPRAAPILEAAAGLAEGEAVVARRWELVSDVLSVVGRRTGDGPNSDFALGALVFVADMRADAGAALFAVARTAGWIAHALEEYAEAPLRFRARALYTGLAPA